MNPKLLLFFMFFFFSFLESFSAQLLRFGDEWKLIHIPAVIAVSVACFFFLFPFKICMFSYLLIPLYIENRLYLHFRLLIRLELRLYKWDMKKSLTWKIWIWIGSHIFHWGNGSEYLFFFYQLFNVHWKWLVTLTTWISFILTGVVWMKGLNLKFSC